ncbi:MAG: hypothetical protein IPM21_15670 [Acidobacteria bacterium]|nr:hypothetical protein [Acidobacteriota bacterium]
MQKNNTSGPSHKTLISGGLCLAALLFVMGCGSLERFTGSSNTAEAPANTTTPSTETNTAETATQTATLGNCANDYYPINSGAENYKVTGAAPGSYTLTQKLNDPNSFSETRAFDSGVNVTTNWICDADGLRNAQYGNNISVENAAFDMETLESKGLTIPRELSVGKAWDATYKVRVKGQAGGMNIGSDGDVVVRNKVVSLNDKITAGGKEFEAAKVDTEITINLTMGGQKVPGMTIKGTNWFAKGVGLVKQEVRSPYGAQGVELTEAN